MTHDACPVKEVQEAYQQLLQGLALLGCAGVGGMILGIETALVADADGAPVVGTGVRPHLQQAAVLGQRAVATEVEVVAHGAEATGAVVAQQPLHGVGTVGARGGAMDDEEADTVRSRHQRPVLHGGQELAFIGDDVAHGDGELVVNHGPATLKKDTRGHGDTCDNGGQDGADGVDDGTPLVGIQFAHSGFKFKNEESGI